MTQQFVPAGPALRQVVEETMSTYRVPGIAVAVAERQRPVRYLSLGTDAAGRPLDRAAIVPVASITKLATALVVLRLVESGSVGLDDPLAKYAPDAAAATPEVTIRKLLSHRSGLPSDVSDEAVLVDATSWPAIAQACLQTTPVRPPDTWVQYSNVGYGLLALVVERVTGERFPAVMRRLVLDPLAIEGYLGDEPARDPLAIADVRGPGARTDREPFNSRHWRSLGLPWVGLLTTVDGVLGLIGAFRGDRPDLLSEGLRWEALRNQVGMLGGGAGGPLTWPWCPWGLGPELRDDKTPHWAPPAAGPSSFGHAGMSGCVVWSTQPLGETSPVPDVCWVILGTRTAENGWLLRRGPVIGNAALREVGENHSDQSG